MKLLIESVMVFFGTLIAAALVALVPLGGGAEPVRVDHSPPVAGKDSSVFASTRMRTERNAIAAPPGR